MRGSIILTIVAGVCILVGIIGKIVAMNTSPPVLLFGLHPDAYLRFTKVLLLFAISIACIIKFRKG
jgi:hypothetical protein